MYTGTRGNIHFGLQLQMTTCGCLALTLGSMVGVCISKRLFTLWWLKGKTRKPGMVALACKLRDWELEARELRSS